ncbi:DUF6691 family protein [Roseobacter sp. HKCCA0434]|uniref:DUF6691 family protein n=1 Tax=Roseobacter sp. HKCCA0434 TaxID=3079297 RepID=UPI002905E5F7|nr:DUF6691 family protein [Roseobacter sp. HKCCA0434]
MRGLFGFAAGLVFGIGLIVSGMADPAKVLNFLDIFGSWDPSLAFVMGGASLTAFVGYRLVWIRPKPLLMPDFQIPDKTRIDRPLLTGAAIFGIGWGIGGFCPGPAWTALPMAAPGTLVFVPLMLVGILIGRRMQDLPFFKGE